MLYNKTLETHEKLVWCLEKKHSFGIDRFHFRRRKLNHHEKVPEEEEGRKKKLQVQEIGQLRGTMLW